MSRKGSRLPPLLQGVASARPALGISDGRTTRPAPARLIQVNMPPPTTGEDGAHCPGRASHGTEKRADHQATLVGPGSPAGGQLRHHVVDRQGHLPDRAADARTGGDAERTRSEEHTSELQSLMRNSYAVFCLKKKKNIKKKTKV